MGKLTITAYTDAPGAAYEPGLEPAGNRANIRIEKGGKQTNGRQRALRDDSGVSAQGQPESPYFECLLGRTDGNQEKKPITDIVNDIERRLTNARNGHRSAFAEVRYGITEFTGQAAPVETECILPDFSGVTVRALKARSTGCCTPGRAEKRLP